MGGVFVSFGGVGGSACDHEQGGVVVEGHALRLGPFPGAGAVGFRDGDQVVDLKGLCRIEGAARVRVEPAARLDGAGSRHCGLASGCQDLGTGVPAVVVGIDPIAKEGFPDALRILPAARVGGFCHIPVACLER